MSHTFVKELIQSSKILNLATISPDGQPWSTPLRYVFDKEYNFYWFSMRSAHHSQNIYANEKTAVTIYDPNFDGINTIGIYMTGTSFEIPETDLERVVKIYTAGKHTEDSEVRNEFVQMTEDFRDKSPLRFYTFCPKELWISDRKEFRNNKWLDQRKEIILPL